MRKIFCQELIKYFDQKPFVFLTGDLGYNALEPLQARMGKYFINAGVAEQNMISTAAGIAKSGMRVFCYSIAPFIYARPYEQIRNDLCLHNLPVTLVGNGGGYGYGVMGATHHAIEDYGALMRLQNMSAFIPVFSSDISAMITKIDNSKSPNYLRLGLVENKNDLPYQQWRKALNGELGCVIAIGSIAGKILLELEKIPQKNRPNLWILSELPINNFPQELINDIQNNKLCIFEEHVAGGSAGQMTATKLLSDDIKIKSFLHLHAKGYPSQKYGSQNFHRQESGLVTENILSFF